MQHKSAFNFTVERNQKYLEYLLTEYIEKYYNPERTHQGIDCQTPILHTPPQKTKISETNLVSKPILGGLYHAYKIVVA